MKKSLIALFALGCVASAAQVTEKFEFNYADVTNPTGTPPAIKLENEFDLSQAWELSMDLVLSPSYLSKNNKLVILSGIVTNDANLIFDIRKANSSSAAPNAYFTFGTANTQQVTPANSALNKSGLTLNLTIKHDVGGDVTVTYSGDIEYKYTKSLGANDFSEENILTGFSTSMMKAHIESKDSWASPTGTFTGTAVNASPAVPEPTTATLSLLALAGLAARRRRK